MPSDVLMHIGWISFVAIRWSRAYRRPGSADSADDYVEEIESQGFVKF